MPTTRQQRRSTRLQKRSINTADDGNDLQSTSTSTLITAEQYQSMKVTQLKDLLRGRGLSTSGVKSVLIERLTETPPPPADMSNMGHVQSPSKRARKVTTALDSIPEFTEKVDCLPRTREMQLQSNNDDPKKSKLFVIGVDEAGRGPLAGPVVAAAAIVPSDIAGVIDSKKITKESERERLYEELIESNGIKYAVAVVSAQRIDEINILQATLEGMRMATEAVINIMDGKKGNDAKANNVASAERKEISYVITGGDFASKDTKKKKKTDNNSYYTLIDGNKVPKDMPYECESMTKGDGREYSIGAASILAKVTRDRLMHEYDAKYPKYNLSQHKGYPTAAHMSAVREHGASPIHRRTFAPLKHMEFDDDGNIIGQKK